MHACYGKIIIVISFIHLLQESVGPDNIEGFGKVNALAEFLVTLKDHSGAVTNQQAAVIIGLWNSLHPYDRQPTKFPPHHRDKLTQGRFKVSKTSVIPGVDGTKR